MLFTNDLVFIHIPKTGGMSCANYLLRTLKAPIYNRHAGAEKENSRLRRGGLRAITDINRHCILQQADRQLQRMQGRSIGEMKLLLAVIRHPFTLEYSFYLHLRKPGVIRRRGGDNARQIELARGDFKTFVAEAGYHRSGLHQEDYFLVDGRAPANLQLTRFEDMAHSLPRLVEPCRRDRVQRDFPHRHSSGAEAEALSPLLDQEARGLIYQKHNYLFDQGIARWLTGADAFTGAARSLTGAGCMSKLFGRSGDGAVRGVGLRARNHAVLGAQGWLGLSERKPPGRFRVLMRNWTNLFVIAITTPTSP